MLDFTSLGIILDDYPDVNFIRHGPLFWKHISGDAKNGGPTYPDGAIKEGGLTCQFLRDYSNLYADLSASGFIALKRDRDFAKRFLQEFGHKILFGSDNEFFENDSFLDSLDLPSDIVSKIYGQNAVSLVC